MRRLSLRLLLALCLIASTAQGFIAQTHVHARIGTAVVAGVASAVSDAPGTRDQACVLCDIAGHSPAVAPPAHDPSLVLATVAPVAPPLASSSTFATVASHHWRGRAPPTV